MRASDWIDLPAFDVGTTYDSAGNVTGQIPDPEPYWIYSLFGTTHGSASGGVSYFPTGSLPTNAASLLPPFVDLGGTGAWNYYPGLDDEWTGADLSAPAPPREILTWAYSTLPWSGDTGATYLGRRSRNDSQWLLLGYCTVSYTRNAAAGLLAFPDNNMLAAYYAAGAIGVSVPPGSGDDSWSWVETNAGIQVEPILPASIDIGFFIGADTNRVSGMITIYAHWLLHDETPISDYWQDDVPGAGWVEVGSVAYNTAQGWATTTIDISGLVLDGAPLNGTAQTSQIAIALRNTADTWLNPALGTADDDPVHHDVWWTKTSVMAHYAAGAVKYRFVGPEVIEGGPPVVGSHIGVVDANGSVLIDVVSNGTVTDTVSWPFGGVNPSAGDILAVARPATRAGTRATFLMRG